MTQNNTSEISLDDPRMGLAKAVEAVGALIETVTYDQLSLPTPCTDFTVKDLVEHLAMVMQRVAILGNGGAWNKVDESMFEMESGHAAAFQQGAHDTMEAWTDARKLERVIEVPFGALPGGAALLVYTAEVATHGWDLATALGTTIEIEDQFLHAALGAAKVLPADNRGEPGMPFDAVVEPAADAPILLHIAGWLGRKVA
jgi:uncharacterized protein (TIGR03086 family)